MATKSSSHPLHFDKRVVDRFIRSGAVKREDYEKHLAALTDVESQSEVITTTIGEDDLEDDSDLDDDDQDEE
jgi:hypothetical protein